MSEIKIHQLRIQGVVRYKTSGYPDYVPFVCVDDIRRWIAKNNWKPTRKL